MKKYLVLLFLLIPSLVFADTYYVDQLGAGTGLGTTYENRASLDYYEAGIGVFADQNGHVICKYGFLSSTSSYIAISDDDGIEGSPVILNGSAIGVCAGGGSPAQININDSSMGYYSVSPHHLIIRHFKFRNQSSEHANNAIKFFCASGDPCNGVTIEDNDIQTYSQSGGNLSSAILTDGVFPGLVIQRNTVLAKNIYGYEGIQVRTQSYSGNMEDITIVNNIVNNWRHGNITVQLLDAINTSTVKRVKIINNSIGGYERGYCRGVGVIQLSGGDVDNISEIWIGRNNFNNLRAPQQVSGKNISIYKNIIQQQKNVCGPTSEGYYGDTACQEESLCSDGWGSAHWGGSTGAYRGTGQGWVAGINTGVDGYAFFQNTTYKVSESSFQVRNSTTLAVGSNDIKVVGCIFEEDAILATGTWTSGSPCWTYDDDPGDSNPPGSGIKSADCSVWFNQVNSINLQNAVINNNLWNVGPTDNIFCHSDSSGALMYTKDQAETAFSNAILSISDNITADPLLVDPDNDNFNLKTGSPAIDQGFHTTVKSNTGSGIAFNVGNALFLGAPGEIIKTATGKTGIIKSIYYSDSGDDTITLEATMAWVKDEGIGLNYNGASPDMGAVEYEEPIISIPGGGKIVGGGIQSISGGGAASFSN